jgi:uncharacterized protein with PQ loop repeat
MTITDALAVGATIAGLTMAIAPALQMRRMLRTGSSRDVSIGYLSLLCVGFLIWMSYGVALGNLPMMLSNTASLTFMVATISVALYLRRGSRGAAARPTGLGEPPRG